MTDVARLERPNGAAPSSLRRSKAPPPTPGTFPRPRRAAGPIAAGIFSLFAYAGVAHNSGSGWVQALGALLGGFLLIGLVAPAFATRRLRLAVVESPSLAIENTVTTVKLSLSTPAAVRFIHPEGPEVTSGRLGRDRAVSIPIAPRSRGILDHAVIELASAAPFGLIWWRKRVTVPLPRPLLICPGFEASRADLSNELPAVGEGTKRVPQRIGESRGVRPYESGDRRHWVHWPATAHRGELMVREMEVPESDPVILRVQLPLDLDDADVEARRIVGGVAELLREGHVVFLLDTASPGGTPQAVPTVEAAGRFLAAVPPRRDFTHRVHTKRRRRSVAVGASQWLETHPEGGPGWE